jgi:hypothetical protein
MPALPAEKASTRGPMLRLTGKFHGDIIPTTP